MRSELEALTHSQRAAMGATAGDLARAGQEVAPAADMPADRRPVLETWEQMFALLLLAAGFDGRERSEYEAQTWFKVLAGLPIRDIEKAITEHYQDSRYPVMPADIIHIIQEGELS